MEYTVSRLARMSGVSARTLRYYDETGLLRPARLSSGGYRIYGRAEVDRLQQILFYRELGVRLDEIGAMLDSPDYDRAAALRGHLAALAERKERLELLMANVQKTIDEINGGKKMNDNEKFDGLREKLIRENEAAYGKELREKYGEDVIDASNASLRGMTSEQWRESEALRTGYEALLKKAAEAGDPASPDAQEACELHGRWLRSLWAKGAYSRQAHRAMADMYVGDERFRAYYDNIAPGGAAFLRDALDVYCGK